jgi:hypothetical protein
MNGRLGRISLAVLAYQRLPQAVIQPSRALSHYRSLPQFSPLFRDSPETSRPGAAPDTQHRPCQSAEQLPELLSNRKRNRSSPRP